MSKNTNEQNLPSVNTTTDKILPNSQNMKQDILKFKDEILREMKLIKKAFTEKYDLFELLTKENFIKYEKELISQTDKINDLKSQFLGSDSLSKEIESIKDFKNKFSDTMLTLDIKITNLEKETKNDIYRIDNILTDSVIYTGIIGRTSKFKTFHQMIDYLLSQTSQNSTYREKNILDFNQIKKKISFIEQGMNNMRDNLAKDINFLFKQKMEECNAKLNDLVEEYDKKILNARQKSIEFIQEIQNTVEKFKGQVDEYKIVKNKISDEIKEELNKLVKENEKTQNLFLNNKNEFNLLKDKFAKLTEYIKDIKLSNLGKEIKRNELNQISEKNDFSKKQKISNDKNTTVHDTKYQNDYDIPDFLKKGQYSEESKVIINNKIKRKKNYNNISKDFSEENSTDKIIKFSMERNSNSDININKVSNGNTTKRGTFNFEKTDAKLKENIKQNEMSTKLSQNKIINKTILNEEMKNDSKGFSKFQSNKSPQRKIIFSGLNNRDSFNLKNLSSLQGKTYIFNKPILDENGKLTTSQSKLILAEHQPLETIKSNSNIFFNKKTTVKNLVRIQSALSSKYPDVFNQIKKSDSLVQSSPTINNQTALEVDKGTNTKKKIKLINKEPTYVYFSYNKNKRNNSLRSHLSPNVKILRHSVEQYDNNNSETKNLVNMVDTLQKYINSQNNYYITKKEIKEEKEKRKKNSEYFKLKEFFSENINNSSHKKSQKDKDIIVNIGIKEKI